MKKIIAAAVTVCLSLTLFTGMASAAENTSEVAPSPSPQTEAFMPVDVITTPDKSEIRKVYEIHPSVDPEKLPRDSFERDKFSYECADILREVVVGEQSQSVTEAVSVESKKNDMDTVLSLLPQTKEVTTEDGFTGTLLLDISSIKSEVSGYGSTSSPYSVTRSYPNLSDADTQYIPKTVDDNGKTLDLQDIQWQTDNTYNVDDYEIGNRYTAIVTYGGTKTSSYVKGYIIDAEYKGEVFKTGVSVIRYTVIFTGAEIPEPTPITTPEPTPDTTTPAENTEPSDANGKSAGSSNGSSAVPTVISVLALIASGASIWLALNKHKEKKHYEEVSDYSDSGSYADERDGDSDDGSGEC